MACFNSVIQFVDNCYHFDALGRKISLILPFQLSNDSTEAKILVVYEWLMSGCHDIQHNDTQHNDIQHNDIHQKNK